MLKRHRPVSPPPSGPSIPFVSDPPEPHRRESKRRRILPPSLDGQARRSTFRTDEDDGEEDDDGVDLSYEHNASGSGPAHNTEYKSANTFLHDLHALHRHRLIFSSSSPPFLQPELPSTPHFQDKSHLQPTPDYPRMPDKQDLSGMQDFGRELPFEEVESVKERYEDTNRLRQFFIRSGFSISYFTDFWDLCF
jgi:hypothetical protein